MHATAGGDVLPCAYMPLSFGNVREEDLGIIWERMGKHASCRSQADYCLMRDPDFRKRYIHTIPEGERLPLRMDLCDE